MNGDPSAQFQGIERADPYVKGRPKVPSVVVEKIIQFLKEKYEGELDTALDVGCGNGQCASVLAPYFRRVVATDISTAQIIATQSLHYPSNVEFQVSPAERCPVQSGSVQLISASTAAHWFDLPSFFKEVERVLCPNGVVALSSMFNVLHFDHGPGVSDQLCRAMDELYNQKLQPYKHECLKIFDNLYADIVIPYDECKREVLLAESFKSMDEIVGYIHSWSCYKNYCQVNGDHAGLQLIDELKEKFKQALNTDEPLEKIRLETKAKYVLLLGRK